MKSSDDLKERLRQIKENDYEAESDDEILELIPLMLENIGSTDSKLRDAYIYSTFCDWILNDKLTKIELRGLCKRIISEKNIFFHIGEVDNDTVFTRTFSMLLIPLLLMADKEVSFLDDEEIIEIYTKLISYLELEKDYRGFVKGKGWAHSIAHLADAIREIANYEVMDAKKMITILESIREKITEYDFIFNYEEDERLALAIGVITMNDVLREEDIISWIDRIIGYEKKHMYPEDIIVLVNIKSFLRSLYFRLLEDEKLKPICDHLVDALHKIDKFKL